MNLQNVSAAEITGRIRETGFSGVVSLSPLGAGPSLEMAFRFADWGHRVPNNIETWFAMASGCKIFTAAAVGLLMQDGKIELGTRLADCVRSRKFHFGSQVTIAQLLNHTSGVPDYFNEEVQSDYAELWTARPCYSMTSPKDSCCSVQNGELKAKPGQEFLYSDFGYILLGLVIEELTGRYFRELIAERIFRPCGMTGSGYFAMDALPGKHRLWLCFSGKERMAHEHIFGPIDRRSGRRCIYHGRGPALVLDILAGRANSLPTEWSTVSFLRRCR